MRFLEKRERFWVSINITVNREITNLWVCRALFMEKARKMESFHFTTQRFKDWFFFYYKWKKEDKSRKIEMYSSILKQYHSTETCIKDVGIFVWLVFTNFRESVLNFIKSIDWTKWKRKQNFWATIISKHIYDQHSFEFIINPRFRLI